MLFVINCPIFYLNKNLKYYFNINQSDNSNLKEGWGELMWLMYFSSYIGNSRFFLNTNKFELAIIMLY